MEIKIKHCNGCPAFHCDINKKDWSKLNAICLSPHNRKIEKRRNSKISTYTIIQKDIGWNSKTKINIPERNKQ